MKKAKFISSSKTQRMHKKVDAKNEKGKHKREDLPEGAGTRNKNVQPHKVLKAGMVDVFNRSRAPAILQAFLNLQLPEQLIPKGRKKLTEKEDEKFRALVLANFKWAVEQVFKVIPKELTVGGSIAMEHSLAGLTRRATQESKSAVVIDMVQERRERELLEHKQLLEEQDEYTVVVDTTSNE